MDTAHHPKDIAVQFDSVSFAYGDVPVLKDASFHIHCGEFAALVGPNGSGKTTVLKLILGLEQPAAGRITLFGVSGKQAYKRIGYVPQHPPADQSFPIQVRDVVRMGLLHPSKGYGQEAKTRAEEAMEQSGITDLAARSWKALSGGQRRRVLTARALAAQPDLLILDEPTANMDAESEARLFETLGTLNSANSTTILIVTHDMDFVSALTGRVLCLADNEHNYKIVQHRTEAAGIHHGDMNVRVLHGENIPEDDCC